MRKKFHKIKNTYIAILIATLTLSVCGVTSAASSTADVYIDGIKQTFTQPAVNMNGSVMVPMRAIFEKLGATIEFNAKTQKIIATKGSTTVTLTIGSDRAFVNGNLVVLTTKAQTINNSTLVPLRFVSEALGAKVSWDAKQNAAMISTQGVDNIPLGNQNTTPPITGYPGPDYNPAAAPTATKGGATALAAYSTGYMGGTLKFESRTVRYGKHDYFSLNQKEYDFVMQKVDAAVANYASIPLPANFQDYLDGARANHYTKGSTEEINLYVLDGGLGDLVAGGVSPKEILKVYQLSMVASNLVKGAKDPGTGRPLSAYDTLGPSGIVDCDADSQVYSAVFDTQGYSTAVYGTHGHSGIAIKIQGNWYGTATGGFATVVLGSDYLSTPTY